MIDETGHNSIERASGGGAHALLEIAAGLADGVHTLIPNATAAVVVAVGSEWQLLAARGSIDIPARWRPEIAKQVRDSDLPQQHGDYLVAPFSSVGMHALLIVATDSKEQMPRRAHGIVQPLLDAGGILLDRALTVQERDRAVRRVVRTCSEGTANPVRTLADLERAVASLWPSATARFYDPNALVGTCWSGRRLIRVACDLDRPSIGCAPACEGLMPHDSYHQVAIPVASLGGAILLEALAGGEQLDTRSLATAISLVRDCEHVLSADELAVAHHA